jgi:hypothetical protein
LFGTFYFQGISNSPSSPVVVPVSNPTMLSAKRAVTTSFGSICFGSLIIALIETLRFVVRTAREQARNSDNGGMAMVLACAECFIGIIEGYLEFLNGMCMVLIVSVYAFTQVAVYGKGYCEAASSTWELIKSRGIDLIINDDLVGSVLGMGSMLVGLLSGLVTVAVIKTSLPYVDGTVQVIGFVSAFIAAVIQFSVLAQVISSGTATTFVCLALDEKALERTKPMLWAAFLGTYAELGIFGGREEV